MYNILMCNTPLGLYVNEKISIIYDNQSIDMYMSSGGGHSINLSDSERCHYTSWC